MTGQLAVLAFGLFVAWLLALERSRGPVASRSLWVVVFWVVLIGSRPVSTWFGLGGGTDAEAYDEGNPIERAVYFVLIVQGLLVLGSRRVRFSKVVRENQWLAVFFVYWGLSVFWSEAPFVAFKRWIKDLGNVVMILMILTEKDPAIACKALFARCAYLLVPLSVMLIKFFPELGRTYHVWSGEMMFTGVATHKNTLGVLVLVCGLFIVHDLIAQWRLGWQRNRMRFVAGVSLLAMNIWLLIRAGSATAMGCGMLGGVFYWVLGMRFIQKRARRLGRIALIGIVLLYLLNSVVDLGKLVVVDILGRDMTLTTRTEVWPRLLEMSDNALLGAGFNSFWSGDRLAVIYDELGIIQAHNGYLETYLNGGVCALILLTILMFSTARKLQTGIMEGSETARAQFMFLLIAAVYDLTEAAFNKMGLIWFVLLLAVVRYSKALRPDSVNVLATSVAGQSSIKRLEALVAH